MKKETIMAIAIGAALTVTSPVMAVTDYSSYTLQELAQMRGTMVNKSLEERQAFRDAWRAKMQSASPEERASYAKGKRRGSSRGYAGNSNAYKGQGNGTCNGSGQGMGKGHGRRGRW